MKAIITVGISASGKSTWAKEQTNFRVLERDYFRREVLRESGRNLISENMWKFWKFSKENEHKVTDMYNSELELCKKKGFNVICADTNLNIKYRNILINQLENLGYEVEIKYFPIHFMEAVKRDELRRDTVGRDVIYKQLKQYKEHDPAPRKKYEPSKELPIAIIVDIDGTLAHMNGKRSAFEWDKVGLDDIDSRVESIINKFGDSYKIIIMSGRDGCCETETRNWLINNEVLFDSLFMRAAGDMRKDSIVKEELFWTHIAANYNVNFVVDDRPQVCRMWRDLGLFVFQVGDPHEEF